MYQNIFEMTEDSPLIALYEVPETPYVFGLNQATQIVVCISGRRLDNLERLLVTEFTGHHVCSETFKAMGRRLQQIWKATVN